MPTLGNPAGLWALLALPAIIAVHFLQRQSRKVVTSTLFLLDELAPRSTEGTKFERLRTSALLWLQIAAALFLTWTLIQPRWLRADSIQHAVVVVDSSISLAAFHDELMKAVEDVTGEVEHGAARTEWHLLESDRSRPTLYSGMDRSALRTVIKDWQPHLGRHDAGPALQLARSLLKGNGPVIFISDRRCELPDGVRLVAIGHPLENWGFCGCTITGRQWQALVRNYGNSEAKRHWWIEAAGEKSAPQEISLSAGQSVKLSGEIPGNASACEVALEGDAFAVDDRLPMVLPELKRLRVGVQPGSALAPFFEQLLGTIEGAEPSGEMPDVQIQTYDSFAPRLPTGNAIIFVTDPQPANELLPGRVTSENSPLVANLNWSGLLCRHSFRVPEEPGDEALVWQGARPLVFLRKKNAALWLVVNFDLRASNAMRFPPFVLMLHRFVEQIRSAKVAYEARNFDTNEVISVASDPTLPPPRIAGQSGNWLSGPATPGFFNITQGDKVVLRGAAQFADAREADFRDAISSADLGGLVGSAVATNSDADFLTPVWILLMAFSMIASWSWRTT